MNFDRITIHTENRFQERQSQFGNFIRNLLFPNAEKPSAYATIDGILIGLDVVFCRYGAIVSQARGGAAKLNSIDTPTARAPTSQMLSFYQYFSELALRGASVWFMKPSDAEALRNVTSNLKRPYSWN